MPKLRIWYDCVLTVEWDLFLFQQSGLVFLHSSAICLASIVNACLLSLQRCLHLSPKIILMALKSKSKLYCNSWKIYFGELERVWTLEHSHELMKMTSTSKVGVFLWQIIPPPPKKMGLQWEIQWQTEAPALYNVTMCMWNFYFFFLFFVFETLLALSKNLVFRWQHFSWNWGTVFPKLKSFGWELDHWNMIT